MLSKVQKRSTPSLGNFPSVAIETVPTQVWLKMVFRVLFHRVYPLTATVVGRRQMISQPISSIFRCSPLTSRIWRTPGLSIPWCCLPTSCSVCLVFFHLSLCLARWFWPDLMNGRHDHTTAVCVSLRWSGLRVVRIMYNLVHSGKIGERFLFLRLSPPCNPPCDALSFVPARNFNVLSSYMHT